MGLGGPINVLIWLVVLVIVVIVIIWLVRTVLLIAPFELPTHQTIQAILPTYSINL